MEGKPNLLRVRQFSFEFSSLVNNLEPIILSALHGISYDTSVLDTRLLQRYRKRIVCVSNCQHINHLCS